MDRLRPCHPSLSGHQQRTSSVSSLPQFYADRFGWQEYADQVERISEEPLTAKNNLLQSSSGMTTVSQARSTSLGHDLPFAIGRHNNYFLWGPQGKTGEVFILLGSDGKDPTDRWSSVTVVGEMNNPYAMPYERRKIYLCRGLKMPPLPQIWPKFKHYI